MIGAGALSAMLSSCASAGTKFDGDDDGSSDSDSDTDVDTDTDADSDSDVDECLYECMSEALCTELEGTVHDDMVCDDESEVCCDPGSDTDTDVDTDIDTDTDSDTDTDTDADTDTGVCPYTCVSTEAMCSLLGGTVDSSYDCPDPGDVCCDATTSCELDELETFDSNIPAGWTVVDGGTSAGLWEWVDDIPDEYPANFSSNGGVFINSQAAGDGSVQDDDLESPLYDLGGCESALLSYDYNFQKDTVGDDAGEVYVVPGGIDTPVLLVTHTADSPLGTLVSHSVPITSEEIGSETTFKVVFHYEGANDLGWYVDNVAVEGVP
jgi:hypothetical protein